MLQMEYCEKDTLRQLIDSGKLHTAEDKVWRLFREIAEGLEHIHSKVRLILNSLPVQKCESSAHSKLLKMFGHTF